jgi:hypothetical protein
MRVQGSACALGDVAIEAKQIEAVAAREQSEEFVLRHDLAIGAEPLRAGNRVAMPRGGVRREPVDVEVADEHLVRRIRARGVPGAQVRAEVADRRLDPAQLAQRLRAQAHEARHVREHERHVADDGHH